MDSKTFRDTMQMNQSIVMSMYEYLKTRKQDIAIALELTQPTRSIAVGVVIGAAVYYGLSYKSVVSAPTKFGERERVAFISPQGNSVVDLSINEFEFYAAPYLINRLDLIRSTVLSPINTQLHTEACFQEQVSIDCDIALWKLKWPHYCRSCKGAGVHVTSATKDDPGGVDPCLCTDPQDESAPKCPRCGRSWPTETHSEAGITYTLCEVVSKPTPCPYCKWNQGHGPTDVLPEWPGCDCTN